MDDDNPTFIVPVSGRPGEFLVGFGRRIRLLRWDGSSSKDGHSMEDVCLADPDREGNRLNDGKVDRAGRLWAGTMPVEDPRYPGEIPLRRGALYNLSAGRRLTRALEEVSLSNGLDWSEDGGTLYFIDSKAGAKRS